MRSRRLLAALIASLALSSSVWAREMHRELIYGAELMTPSERERYRQDAGKARSPEAGKQVVERHRMRMQERARKRGVDLREDGTLSRGAAKR